jgi:hypothetical protein
MKKISQNHRQSPDKKSVCIQSHERQMSRVVPRFLAGWEACSACPVSARQDSQTGATYVVVPQSPEISGPDHSGPPVGGSAYWRDWRTDW